MSLPDILVLNRFLDDYLEIRQSTWHSTTAALINAGSQLKTTGTQVLSKIYDSLPTFFSGATSSTSQDEVEKIEPQTDEKIITKICTSFKDVFLTAQTIEDWINIIFDLGDQARQSQKRSKGSLLCQTLHAMRAYIIHHLHDEPDFKAYILELEKKKPVLKAEILETRLKSLSTTELEKKRDTLLYNLADLGDEKHIFKCADYGLFDSLHFPKEQTCHQLSHTRELAPSPDINIHKPWYYQKNYFLVYHDKHIKPIKMESFDDFTDRAKKKGKLIVTTEDTSDSSYSEAAQSRKTKEASLSITTSPSQQAGKTPQTPLLDAADSSLVSSGANIPAPVLLNPSPLQLPATSASIQSPITSAPIIDLGASKSEKDSSLSPKALQESPSNKPSVTAGSSIFATGNSKKKNKKGQQQTTAPSQAIGLHH